MIHNEKSLPIAFVTGTSSGFGLLTSVALAKEGYHVVASMRNLERRGRLEKAAIDAGVSERMEIVELDVTDFPKIDPVIADVLLNHGKIDLLINNAGFAQGGAIEQLSIEDWKRQFDTNFFGLVAVTKAVLPSMRERGSGTIVNISSISGQFGLPGIAPYASSKFAVEGFSEALRLEMLPFGIRVLMVEPGVFKTDIWEKGLEGAKMDETSPYAELERKMLKAVNKMVEVGGDPSDVATTILRAVKSPYPDLHNPVGKGVKTQMRLKRWLQWKWIEKNFAKQFKLSPPANPAAAPRDQIKK